jgi:hypothetical protein
VGELADKTVGGSAECDGKDDANGEELDGNLLEGTDALGDGVGCWVLLVLATRERMIVVTKTNQSAPPSVTVLVTESSRLATIYIQEQATSS